MAVTFVAAGTLNAAAGESVSITAPACNADDLLLALVMERQGISITAPDGTWTQIHNGNYGGGSGNAATFWKKATGSGGSFTFTHTAGSGVIGGYIVAYRGQDLSTPLDATAVGVSDNSTSDALVTFPAFNPTGTDSHIVFIAYYYNDTTTFAAAMSSDTNPDCTLRSDQETATGTDFSIAITSGDTTDGSNIATRTWDSGAGGASDKSAGVVFGIAVAAAAVTTKHLQLLGIGK